MIYLIYIIKNKIKIFSFLVRITIPSENHITFSGAGLKNSYRFDNLHFHWPSEHQINEER